MKTMRALLAMAVVGMAACSSPTTPRLPDPDGDDRKPPPDKPGVVATAAPTTIQVTFVA